MNITSVVGLIVGALILANPVTSRAGDESDYKFQDGNALLSVCGEFVSAFDRNTRLSEHELVSVTACTSYLRGFSHGVALLSSEPEQGCGYCLDASIPLTQIARVVVKSLRENPSTLHYHPAPLVVQALRGAFPCRKQ